MASTKDAAAAEEKDMVEEAREFFKLRPSLTAAQYIALLEPEYDEYWSRQDEKDLDTRCRQDPIHKGILGFGKAHTSIMSLWRVFPRVYRQPPTSLISVAYKLRAHIPVGKGFMEVWNNYFCDALTAFALHGFWTWNAEMDFPLMAQLIQLAIRSRTNDCRPWELVNHTRDRYVDEVIEELDNDVDNSTIVEILDRVDDRLGEGEAGTPLRPTQMQSLFRAIVTAAFKDVPKLVVDEDDDGSELYYSIRASDLDLLNSVLSTFGPSAERAVVRGTVPANTWKRVMNVGRSAEQRRELPRESQDLFRVISLGVRSWKRHEMRETRQAEGYAHPERVPDHEPPTGGRIWTKPPFASTLIEAAPATPRGRGRSRGSGGTRGAQSGRGRGGKGRGNKRARSESTDSEEDLSDWEEGGRRAGRPPKHRRRIVDDTSDDGEQPAGASGNEDGQGDVEMENQGNCGPANDWLEEEEDGGIVFGGDDDVGGGGGDDGSGTAAREPTPESSYIGDQTVPNF